MVAPSRAHRAAALGARFLTVGAVSTVIEVAAFNVLAFGLGWNPVAAKVVASLIALINAYFGNRQWAFRGRERRGRGAEVTLFVIVNAACTALGAFLVWLGVSGASVLLGHDPGPLAVNVVNLASIVIVVVARFGLYHFVVFPARAPSAPAGPVASLPDGER